MKIKMIWACPYVKTSGRAVRSRFPIKKSGELHCHRSRKKKRPRKDKQSIFY